MFAQIEDFQNDLLSEGYSQNTLDLYSWILYKLAGHSKLEAPQITTHDLKRFMLYLLQEYTTSTGGNLAPASLSNAWKSLRTFFKWYSSLHDCEDPAQGLKAPKVPPAEIVPLEIHEVKTLLNDANLRDRAIVLTLLDTGLRASELCRLRLDDVNWETGRVFVRPWVSGQKTTSRVVYFSETTFQAILKYQSTRIDDQPHLFVSNNDSPLNRDSLRLIFRRLETRTGIHANPHRWRHTFAINFLRGGGDVYTLKSILGHSTPGDVRALPTHSPHRHSSRTQ